MAKFDCDGSPEIFISPKKFVNNCSSSELVQLKELIVDEFDLVDSDFTPEEEPKLRSFSQIKFNKSLYVLKNVWYSLTKTDEATIDSIAKKYE
jgi:hypothetical protein